MDWSERASAAARATLLAATAALDAIGPGRPRVREPVLLAHSDARELQHLRQVAEFVPTLAWQQQWLQDLNHNAAALSRMEVMLRATDDPLAAEVHSVAVTVALSIAIVAAAPVKSCQEPCAD